MMSLSIFVVILSCQKPVSIFHCCTVNHRAMIYHNIVCRITHGASGVCALRGPPKLKKIKGGSIYLCLITGKSVIVCMQ